MFCLSFFAILKPCLARPTTKTTSRRIEPTITTASGYANIDPMIQTSLQDGRKLLNVVKAETEFGISFFEAYRGLVINEYGPYLLFSARLRKSPGKSHIISCPLNVQAGNLEPLDQSILQLNLDNARSMVPESAWRILRVKPSDGLLICQSEQGSNSDCICRCHVPSR
ncbi:uncharacterized protein BO97DRAFT_169739 [Aspergillus homomorphus CBS 101889]|uniref:Uncharacterized protein n=1 Tax=Aspergillus homomorphus (strain CBS 101889) TaxID=1450537 RepID=A0A395HPA6_ASPHC|nr:hypothetical protein BO97DRAFT_169739 [Aspergillus homomorphus CBS 101889]RAL09456.1 hypothetical protein BO97DRAFT_169739 [Aspergillus homomorphus CBS 101889]